MVREERIAMNDRGQVSAPQERPNLRASLHEIDLIEVARDIWGGKYVIVSLAVLGLLFAILTLYTAKPTYTAKMVAGPAESAGGGAGRAGGLGQLGAAASAFGINIGGGDNSYFGRYKEVLDSESLAEALFRRDDLRPVLFGPGWNPETRKFMRPEGLLFNIKELVKGLLGLRTWSSPGPFELREALKAKMTVTLDQLTNLLRISVRGDSPAQAEFVLRSVTKEADELLRRTARERAAGRIAYLNQALRDTTMQDQRESMINILSSQQHNMMMASVDRTFAIEIIDPPAASPVPTSPVPRVTLFMGVSLMGVFGIFAAILYGMRARARQKMSGQKPKTFDEAVRHFIRRR